MNINLLLGEMPEYKTPSLKEWMATPHLQVRDLVNQAKGQASADTNTAAGYGNQAGGVAGVINPINKAQAQNPTGFTANEQNQRLTASEAGTGGGTASLTGAAALGANRTRNTGAGTGGVNDAIQRLQQQRNAGASERIAKESTDLGQQKQQSALGRLQNMYGTDVSAQLHGMGEATDATNAAVNAGKSGWVQNTLATINALKPGSPQQS